MVADPSRAAPDLFLDEFNEGLDLLSEPLVVKRRAARRFWPVEGTCKVRTERELIVTLLNTWTFFRGVNQMSELPG